MLKLYHAPWSRSSPMLWLLEEIGQPFEVEVVDIRAEGGVPEAYRAIQPNKKVPAIIHDGVTVTERAAICIHLGDAFPGSGLAPALGSPERAAWLTWLVYSDAVFDPAIAVRAHAWEYISSRFSFGSFDDMVLNLETTLSRHPYIVGDRFTSADTQIGGGIDYAIRVLKVLPEKKLFLDYLARLHERPAYKHSSATDFEMARQAGMVGS